MNNEQEIRELVIARLETLPDNLEISIGSEGGVSKEEMIEHVKKNDSIGSEIIQAHMSFLQSLKEGSFYEQMYSSNPS